MGLTSLIAGDELMTKRQRYAIQLVIEEEAPAFGCAGDELIECIKDCILEGYDHTLISASSEEVVEGERVRALLVVPDD